MSIEERSAARPVGGRDLVVAAGWLVAATLLFALTRQARFTGDGAGLATMFELGGTYYNVLYLPLAHLVDSLGSFERFGALRWLSVGSAALGVAATFLVARGLGAGRAGASVASLLLAVSPALWFFATTVEVQAVHFGAVSLVACVTVFAPWRRPVLALGLVAAAFPLLYWTQQTSVLLGPGWVLLVQAGRVRVAAPFRWRTLLLVVGPVLLVSLLGAMAFAARQRGVTLFETIFQPLEQVGTHHAMPIPGAGWWNEWIKPLGVLVPLGVVAWFAARARAWTKLAIAVLLLPSIVFFSWWGVAEDGGYFLSSDTFLAALVALAWDRCATSRVAWAATAMLVAGQGTLAQRKIDAYDARYDVEERIRILRATIDEEPGTVLFAAMSDYAPDARIWLPELDELKLWSLLRNQSRIEGGRLLEPEDVLLRFVLPYLADAFTRHDRVLLELAHRHHEGREIDPLMRDLMAGVLVGLAERYDVEERPHPDWGLAIVRPR